MSPVRMLGIALIFIMFVPLVSAQCTVNNEEVPCDVFYEQFGWIFGFVFGIVALILIPFLAFWIWMLYDCYKRPNFERKTVWLLIVFFLTFPGAVLYFLLIKKNLIRHLT